MAKSIRKLLGILTASGFVLLLLSGWFGYRSVQALVHSESDVEKAELTKAQWGDLLSVMKDAETGERGFVITGRENYLEPFQSGKAETYKILALLHDSIHGDPSQAKLLKNAEDVISTKMEFMSETIRLRRDEGLDAAKQLTLTGKGKAVMDELRSIVAEAQTQESNIISARRHREAASRLILMAVFSVTLLAASTLLATIYVVLSRDLVERDKAEAALRESGETTGRWLLSFG